MKSKNGKKRVLVKLKNIENIKRFERMAFFICPK